MISILERIIKKKKIINIRLRRKKVLRRRKAAQKRRKAAQRQGTDDGVFEIQRAFRMAKNDAVICGKVKSGSFKTKDELEIFDMNRNNIKLQGKIKKITTTLVEVNRISSGFETDMLINIINDMGIEIIPGDIALKI